jgi:hypothetical protein
MATVNGWLPCGGSDSSLFGELEGVVNLNTQVSDRAFHFGMPEQDLNGAKILGPTVNQ